MLTVFYHEFCPQWFRCSLCDCPGEPQADTVTVAINPIITRQCQMSVLHGILLGFMSGNHRLTPILKI